ncbi:predicted protein [Naegleria gruberi]|uniref:tRNA threonylcarbamoyladenosine biosynthesis protein TsaE n=1 Tax=Naegleria gruberi TaxID=5762 RepID=D2V794_NAEGR|nr:uncharacterized protein NAEGRDRAFT_57360 [Naegleria gruberi]EFC47333.1 predicted protein [Naegleria gruberi]|eukprot:XP_002680077.1 predicted protein [Naegleria gruberi strain NEG-M]
MLSSNSSRRRSINLIHQIQSITKNNGKFILGSAANWTTTNWNQSTKFIGERTFSTHSCLNGPELKKQQKMDDYKYSAREIPSQVTPTYFEATFVVNSVEETRNLAERFSSMLESTDVVLLIGDMGSGKSVFARHVIRVLEKDMNLNVPSPTFLLDNIYESKMTSKKVLLSNNTTTTNTSSEQSESKEEKTSTLSEPVVENSPAQEPTTTTNEQQTNTSSEQSTTSENVFNLQSTASLIMDSAESLKQKREMLQKELESRKDAEVMLKKVIYRGIRAFGVLFISVCLLIWAVKRKNLEAKVKKFNDKIKKSEEKEQELERELEANFSYIKKDIENKNGTSTSQ